MSMYFYDETEDWPEYKIIKDDIQRLEKAHAKFRIELQQANSAFMSDPANDDLRVRVDRLKNKLKEIEKKLDESLSMYR